MQQGHPRHKQINRARHEMAMHRRYMFGRKINAGLFNFVNGIGRAVNGVAGAIGKCLAAKPHKPTPEIKDIWSEMYKPKGLMQIVPPKFSK